MSKKLKKVVSLFLGMQLVFGSFASCGLLNQNSSTSGSGQEHLESSSTDSGEHYHEYPSWSTNSSEHWLECSCGKKIEQSAHTYSFACELACEICGFIREGAGGHSYTERKYDNKNHWYECECGEKAMIEKHRGGEGTYDAGTVCLDCEKPYVIGGKIEMLAPTGEVYPYIGLARAYLSNPGANISSYIPNPQVNNPQVAIPLKWDSEVEGVTSFIVEYATKSDYSDAIVEQVNDSKRLDLFNLYKGTTYYVRVTGLDKNGVGFISGESTFTTTDLGPRVMNIEGIYNVRDLGGYETASGKKTVQGILYRGGSLTPGNGFESSLTEAGGKYMSEVMGIKIQIDINSSLSSYKSKIPGVTGIGCPIAAYETGITATAREYKKFFELLSNKDNYPIYYSCTGGADRTGTISFLLNALLGVSEEVCIQDYEFTSFSIFGERNSKTGYYGTEFQKFLTKLKSYEGNTLQEKVESYVLSIGVTQEQIDNIKSIMFGEIKISK